MGLFGEIVQRENRGIVMVKYVTILSQLHGWLNPFLEISLNMYNLDVNYEEKFAIFRANTLRDSDSNPGLALNSFPSLRF